MLQCSLFRARHIHHLEGQLLNKGKRVWRGKPGGGGAAPQHITQSFDGRQRAGNPPWPMPPTLKSVRGGGPRFTVGLVQWLERNTKQHRVAVMPLWQRPSQGQRLYIGMSESCSVMLLGDNRL